MTDHDPMSVGSQLLEAYWTLPRNSDRVSHQAYMAFRRVQSDRSRCMPAQKRKMAPLRDSVSSGGPSNNAMQLTGRPHISSKGGAQGARPSRPAADRGR